MGLFRRAAPTAADLLPQLAAALQANQTELANARALEAELRSEIAAERSRSDRLVEQLLEMKREGFAPPVRSPERERRMQSPPAPEASREGLLEEGQDPREDPARAWQRIVGAIQDRAGDNPALAKRMEIDCRRWWQNGMATELIIQRILHGWDGGDSPLGG